MPPCDGMVNIRTIIIVSDEMFEEVGASDDELDTAVLEAVCLKVKEGLVGGLPGLIETWCHAVLSIDRLTT